MVCQHRERSSKGLFALEVVMHYYQYNIGNYRRRTGHLTMLEHGAYRSLMDTYYLEERPLCADLAQLMRTHTARTEDEQKAIKNVLSDFFTLTEAGYCHVDIDEKIATYHGKSEKARQSARIRWENDANAMRTHSDGNANHKPLTINQEPITNNQVKNPAQARRSQKTQLASKDKINKGFFDLFCRKGSSLKEITS